MSGAYERYMVEAIAEARRGAAEGNPAVGCVIVRGDEVIARGCNRVMADRDVTAHAEMVAIREAGQRLGLTDFSGCTLYTTFEPCPMCAGAIIWGNFSRVVLGSRYATFGLRGDYRVELLVAMVHSNLEIVAGILEAECDELMALSA